jgi:hypothetical protein
MLGLFESTGAPWNVQEIPNDFSYGEIEPDWDSKLSILRMYQSLKKFHHRLTSTFNNHLIT